MKYKPLGSNQRLDKKQASPSQKMKIYIIISLPNLAHLLQVWVTWAQDASNEILYALVSWRQFKNCQLHCSWYGIYGWDTLNSDMQGGCSTSFKQPFLVSSLNIQDDVHCLLERLTLFILNWHLWDIYSDSHVRSIGDEIFRLVSTWLRLRWECWKVLNVEQKPRKHWGSNRVTTFASWYQALSMEMHELWHWTRSFHEHLTVDLFVPPLSLHMLRHVGFDATGLEMQKLQPHYICLKDKTCTFRPHRLDLGGYIFMLAGSSTIRRKIFEGFHDSSQKKEQEL